MQSDEIIAKTIGLENNPYLHYLLNALAVFVICLGIDMIRSETTGRLFEKFYNKLADSI